MKDRLELFKSNSFYTGLVLFTFFVFMQLTTWIPLRLWNIWGGGNFIDSQQIIEWSNCYKIEGNAIFQSYGDCPGYIYGSTLVRILSLLNMTPSSAQIFGYVFMLLLALTVSYHAGGFEKYQENPFVLTIVLSPPILLLAERANFDILMLVLVALAVLLFNKNYHSWALLPLALATLVKFYTLPLFLVFFLLNDNYRRKTFTLIAGAMVSARVYLDLELMHGSFPSGAGAKFGVSIWTRYIDEATGSDLGEWYANLSGAVIFTIVCVITLIVFGRLHIAIITEAIGDKKRRMYFYIFFGTHISCYFLGMSYDYRLVFLAIASIIYLYSFVSKGGLLQKVVLVMTILSLWLTYPSSGLAPVGDLATEILTIILGIRCLQLLKLDLKMKNTRLLLW